MGPGFLFFFGGGGGGARRTKTLSLLGPAGGHTHAPCLRPEGGSRRGRRTRTDGWIEDVLHHKADGKRDLPPPKGWMMQKTMADATSFIPEQTGGGAHARTGKQGA